MTLALCFLTIGDLSQPALWDQFVQDAKGLKIVCHPKADPASISTPWLRRGIIDARIPTQHGDISLVDASLNLFSSAFQDQAVEHFILLSETTIPLTPPRVLAKQLKRYKGKSLINYQPTGPMTEHGRRQQALPKNHPFKPFLVHDQWIILARKHVELLLTKPQLDMFTSMFAADEHYFANVLLHTCRVKPSEICSERKTYVNWQQREIKEQRDHEGRLLKRTIHPKIYETLSEEDLALARQQGCWFFRKVSANCKVPSALKQAKQRGYA